MEKENVFECEVVCEIVDSMCMDMDDYFVHAKESTCDSAY